METHKKITVTGVLSEGIGLGIKNAVSMLGATVLWLLTIWIPYLNVGTTIAMNTIPIELSKGKVIYNPQIQISAESETKRSIFREKDKTKRSKKESAQHSKSRNKSFVMTSVSAL